MRGTLTLVKDEITAFVLAFRRYASVIIALLRREEMERRTDPAESLMELAEPCLLIGVISVAHWMLNHSGGSPLGGNPVLFYATGFMGDYFFIYISRTMRAAVDSPNRRYPVEQRLDHIFVHILVSTADYLVVGTLVFTVIYFEFDTHALPYDISSVLEACISIVMFGFGWGVLNLILRKIWWPWQYLYGPTRRVMMFFSGVFFVLDYLPPTTRYILSLNPMAHTIILLRKGFYVSQPTYVLDTGYMFRCAIVVVIVGLLLERATRRVE